MKSIAVIIPFYNVGASIFDAIKSLQLQTFKDWTVVLVDDGSSDDTSIALQKIVNENIILIKIEENSGRGFARQKGLEKVRELGFKYLCMLDADDWYYPNKLEVQFNYMENNPEITLLSSAMSVASFKKQIYRVIKPYETWEKFYCKSYTDFVQLPHASSIIRLKDIDGINYNTNFKFSEDLDFLRRILFNKTYAMCPEILYCYNRDTSFSFLKYYKSIRVNITSYNTLPISTYQKTKYQLISISKSVFVFILSTFGLRKMYLNKLGRKPQIEEIEDYIKLKKYIFESE